MSAMQFFLLIVGLYLAWVIFRVMTSRVPKASERGIREYAAHLPRGFGYPYYLNGTGFGINVEEGKIYLSDAITGKIYDRADIRELRSEAGEYVTNSILGHAAPRDHVNVAIQNRENKRQAFENSGIFISVADIDHPQWQIRVSDSKYSARCYEILRQFMDGQLMPYEEYLKSKK